MNSLEFIKQHVTEWPSDKATQVNLYNDGFAVFSDPVTPLPCHSVDLSEHFTPSYCDGKTWTREDFESVECVPVEYRFNSDLPNALLKREGGDYYYFARPQSEWVKYTVSTLRTHWGDAIEINELMANNYIKQGVPVNESQPPVGTFEQPDVHWDNAPEWATSLGKIGMDDRNIWYDNTRYQYVDNGRTYKFNLPSNHTPDGITHIMDRPTPAPSFGNVTHNKYEREITDRQGNSATVDVYDVIIAFGVTCPATQHAIKKLLCTGERGHKDTSTDLSEARDSITRAIELLR